MSEDFICMLSLIMFELKPIRIPSINAQTGQIEWHSVAYWENNQKTRPNEFNAGLLRAIKEYKQATPEALEVIITETKTKLQSIRTNSSPTTPIGGFQMRAFEGSEEKYLVGYLHGLQSVRAARMD